MPDAGKPATERAGETAYRRRVWAWALYDWAGLAYVTTVATTFFPPLFVTLAAPALLAAGAAGDEAARATRLGQR